tara:strand:- start:3098 stop:3448 length:351 start_codon:yes stop_codon:yes gene_type:complete
MSISSDRIRSLRKSAKLTLDALSVATGRKLTTSRIANYESGIRKLKVEQAIVLAQALNVTPQYLLGLEDLTDGSEHFTDAQKQFLLLAQSIARKDNQNLAQATAILQALLQNTPAD